MERLAGVADTNRGPGDSGAKLRRQHYFSAGSMRLRCLHLAGGEWDGFPPGHWVARTNKMVPLATWSLEQPRRTRASSSASLERKIGDDGVKIRNGCICDTSKAGDHPLRNIDEIEKG